MHCFYLKNLPDVSKRLLLSRIYSHFGYCEVDLFKRNYGSCKIFLDDFTAKHFGLFDLLPHEFIEYKLGFHDLIVVSRWMKTPASSLREENISLINTFPHNIESDDCKSEESFFVHNGSSLLLETTELVDIVMDFLPVDGKIDSLLTVSTQTGLDVMPPYDVGDEIVTMASALEFIIDAIAVGEDKIIFPAAKWRKFLLNYLKGVVNIDNMKKLSDALSV